MSSKFYFYKTLSLNTVQISMAYMQVVFMFVKMYFSFLS